MKKNLKKILACTLALSTLCAVSSLNVSAENVIIGYDLDGIPFHADDTRCEHVGYDANGSCVCASIADWEGSELVPCFECELVRPENPESSGYEETRLLGYDINKNAIYGGLRDALTFEKDGEKLVTVIKSVCPSPESRVFATDGNGNKIENYEFKFDTEGILTEPKVIGYDLDGNEVYSYDENAILIGFNADKSPIIYDEIVKYFNEYSIFSVDDENVRIADSVLKGYDIDGNAIYAGIKDALVYDNYNDEFNMYISGMWYDVKPENAFALDKNGEIVEDYVFYFMVAEGGVIVEEEFSTGDANHDNEIDVRDVTTINQHIIKQEILGGDNLKSADVNNDGNIDVSDLGLLKQYILKMIDSFEI